jgi:hypothetical protein
MSNFLFFPVTTITDAGNMSVDDDDSDEDPNYVISSEQSGEDNCSFIALKFGLNYLWHD